MNNTLPINSSINAYGRTHNQQHFLTNRSNTHLPQIEKRTIGNSLTPMTIKDIDDEIRKLNTQYRMKSLKDLSMGNKGRIFGIENKFTEKNITNKIEQSQFFSSQYPKLNIQDEKNQTNLSVKLPSIDYLKSSNHYSSSTIKNSKNIRLNEFQNVGTSLQDDFLTKRLRSEESNVDLKLNLLNEIRLNKHDIKQESNNYLDNLKQREFPVNIKTDSQTPVKKSPIQIKQQEIIKTTKPISQFMKIYESPSKFSHKTNELKSNITQKTEKKQPSKIRQINLPKISEQCKHLSEGISYIETINERNRTIVNLQNRIIKFQIMIEQKQQLLQKYKLQIQNIKSAHNTTIDSSNKLINKLKKEIELTQMRKYSTNMDIQSKFRKINHQNQQISSSNNALQRNIIDLKKQLDKKKQSQEIYQTTFLKLKNIITEKSTQVIEVQKNLDRITQQNNGLRKRIAQILTTQTISKRLIIDEDKNEVFNSIMKINQQQNTKFKNNLAIKDEQIHRLQELNREFRAANDSLRNQIQIQKLKRMTQINNLQTTFKIEEQVKINEIDSLNKTLHCLQEKLKYIIQEDRKKDEFMLQYLKNRAELPEDKIKIQEFFKNFELLSVNTNIIQCLKREQTEIETLKTQVRKLILRK